MSAMMEILKQMQRDLAEQMDYMRNLHVIHKDINEKFNLMERKIDQQRVTMEMLEQQVRKNNVLLFGNDEAEIDFNDKTNLNNKEKSGHLVEQSEKYKENTEDVNLQNAFQNADAVESNPVSNPVEYVKMDCDKNKIGEFTLSEVKEIKQLIKDYISTTKSSVEEAGRNVGNQETVQISPAYLSADQIRELIRDYIATKSSVEEAGNQVRKQETVQISPTYFSTEQMTKLNKDLKQIAEKYHLTNIFPVIEVIPGPLVNNHPVLIDLSKGVYYREINNMTPLKVNLGSKGFKRSDILEMITENPDVTLYDVVMEGLKSRNEWRKDNGMCYDYDFTEPYIGCLPPQDDDDHEGY